MKEEEQKPRIVEKLDHDKTHAIRLVMVSEITKLIIKYPKSAEAASAALAALIFCAYQLAKNMWGVSEAVRAIRASLDIEAGKDRAKEQQN